MLTVPHHRVAPGEPHIVLTLEDLDAIGFTNDRLDELRKTPRHIPSLGQATSSLGYVKRLDREGEEAKGWIYVPVAEPTGKKYEVTLQVDTAPSDKVRCG